MISRRNAPSCMTHSTLLQHSPQAGSMEISIPQPPRCWGSSQSQMIFVHHREWQNISPLCTEMRWHHDIDSLLSCKGPESQSFLFIPQWKKNCLKNSSKITQHSA